MGNLRAVPLIGFLFSSLICINLAQTMSLVLFPFSRRAFRRFNRWCADTWWGWCVIGARHILGLRLVITGDEVPQHENVLLVSNHQRMTDIPVIMTFARSKGRLGDLKFFVKRALKNVPGIGWGMQFLNCLFIRRRWTEDRELIERTFATIVQEQIPMWLVSFCEGTRITPEKLARSQAFARGNDLEPTNHVLLPRTKGFVASVQGLGEHLDAVYDLTIGYLGEAPSLWLLIAGRVKQIHLHVRRYPAQALPQPEDELSDWLYTRYQEKDRLLAHFRSTGSFST